MISGLLLDSGDTLMRPRGGRWNPRFDFEAVVSRHWPDAPESRFAEAFAAGDVWLRRWSDVAERQGYTSARADYHRVILNALGMNAPSARLLAELDAPLSFTEIVEPFPDLTEGLPALRSDGWSISIVADASVKLVEVYRRLGLEEFISAFVISEELGCSKPDPRMYRTASEALGLTPSECVFVDDRPSNVAAALDLGYNGCAIARYGEPPDDGLDWVRDLSELRRYLQRVREAAPKKPRVSPKWL